MVSVCRASRQRDKLKRRNYEGRRIETARTVFPSAKGATTRGGISRSANTSGDRRGSAGQDETKRKSTLRISRIRRITRADDFHERVAVYSSSSKRTFDRLSVFFSLIRSFSLSLSSFLSLEREKERNFLQAMLNIVPDILTISRNGSTSSLLYRRSSDAKRAPRGASSRGSCQPYRIH